MIGGVISHLSLLTSYIPFLPIYHHVFEGGARDEQWVKAIFLVRHIDVLKSEVLECEFVRGGHCEEILTCHIDIPMTMLLHCDSGISSRSSGL